MGGKFLFYLKLKGVCDSQPLLVLVAELQGRSIGERVTLCGSATGIGTGHFGPFNADGGIVPCKSASSLGW